MNPQQARAIVTETFPQTASCGLPGVKPYATTSSSSPVLSLNESTRAPLMSSMVR